MTRVLFEPDSGRLRLGRTAFDALVDAATGRQDSGRSDLAEVAALRAAGVLDEQGTLHPTVGAAIGAIAEPVCRLILHTQDAQGRQEVHEGWIAGHAAALLLAADNDLHELVSLHPTFLPEAIARLVGLGPRPRVEGAVAVRLTVATVDQLTGSDPSRRAAAADRLVASAPGASERATAQALGRGIRCRWEAVTTWTSASGGEGRRAVHVIDTPAGLWLVEPAGAGLLACPTAPTVVWRVLINLLPRDGELARRHART